MSALETLIEALRRLPGVGQKSAQRMAYHLLQHDRDGALRLSQALDHAVHVVQRLEEIGPFKSYTHGTLPLSTCRHPVARMEEGPA